MPDDNLTEELVTINQMLDALKTIIETQGQIQEDIQSIKDRLFELDLDYGSGFSIEE